MRSLIGGALRTQAVYVAAKLAIADQLSLGPRSAEELAERVGANADPLKRLLRFLDEGDKVKATIFFRGREMTRTSLGREILERLIKDIADKGIVEFRPRQEGNTLHAILAPKKDAGQKEPVQSQPDPGRVNQA